MAYQYQTQSQLLKNTQDSSAGIIVALAAVMHFIYRSKTHIYTKSWMDFKVKEVDGKLVYGRIGYMYYPLVAVILIIATVTILLI